MTKVCRILRDEHNIKVEPSTVMKWRDGELWEAKAMLIDNQVRRLMRSSDDPVLQEMALDDSMFMRFLGIMTRLIEETIGKAAARKRFLPKNPAELMKMMEFIGTHQERILGKQQRETGERAPRDPSFTYNDNRKLVLAGRLRELPVSQRRQIISEMHGAVDQKSLALAREQAFEEDDSTG